MAQGDMNIANQGFPAFRADLNDQLEALVTNSSGATAPATTFPHQWWLDTSTTPSTLRQRNAANDAWIVVGLLNQSTNTFNLPVAQGGTGAADAGGALTNLGALAATNPSYTGTLTGGTGVINIGSGQVYKDASGNVVVGGSTPYLTSAGRGNISIEGSSSAVLNFGIGGNLAFYIFHDNTNVNLQNQKNGAMLFATNATERMRIDSSGSLLIGATSTVLSERLNVTRGGSSLRVIHVENTRNVSGDEVYRSKLGSNCDNTSSYHFIATTGTNDRLYMYGNGNIQNANGSYGTLSDIKLKENIVDATPKLDKLMQVRVVNYNLKTDPELKQIGVVAQELEQVFPGLVDEHADKDAEGNELGTTTKSVKMSVFVPMLIKAMQEQQAIIEQLKARLDAANL
jgi:hypothetical protein